MHYFNIFT